MKIKCPIPQCGQENPPDAIHCPSCGTNLQAYTRLLLMPDDLFNRGLTFSQGGHFQEAEQCLQSALLFNPRDLEATLLLAQVQALQGNDMAAHATFVHTREKGNNDPRLANIVAALQTCIGQAQTSPLSTGASLPLNASGSLSSKGVGNKRKRKKKKH